MSHGSQQNIMMCQNLAYVHRHAYHIDLTSYQGIGCCVMHSHGACINSVKEPVSFCKLPTEACYLGARS